MNFHIRNLAAQLQANDRTHAVAIAIHGVYSTPEQAQSFAVNKIGRSYGHEYFDDATRHWAARHHPSPATSVGGKRKSRFANYVFSCFALDLDDSAADREGDRLRTISGSELIHNVFDMDFHRFLGDAQDSRYVAIAVAAGNLL